jgi:signal transduction histidine kinase
MSVTSAPVATVPRARSGWTAGLATAAILLIGLLLALVGHVPSAVPVIIAVAGGLASIAVLAPQLLGALRRNRGLALALLPVVLAALWVTTGIRHANGLPGLPFGFYPPFHSGQPDPFVLYPYAQATFAHSGWPWRLGRVALLPLVLTLLSAAVGLVLLSDAVRVQIGLEPNRWMPWRLMTEPVQRRTQVAWRALPGALLIGGAAFVGIGLANRYTSGDSLLEAVVALVIGTWAAVLIVSPVLVGALTMVDRDKAGRAREEERQRFAAHLHDSVLQTLALVQRQAHDPVAVARLARRQEHALRAWMAGESELVSETIGAALRDAVATVEDEYGITIELTAIGDRPLDANGEAVVAATREALRNAARHGGGAPVLVFCEIDAARVEVFVRDTGPGFDIDAVASERRGLRDAVIGRMAAIGGRAMIDSTIGEGTEVALELRFGGNGK